jgi:hypothetical protein
VRTDNSELRSVIFQAALFVSPLGNNSNICSPNINPNSSGGFVFPACLLSFLDPARPKAVFSRVTVGYLSDQEFCTVAQLEQVTRFAAKSTRTETVDWPLVVTCFSLGDDVQLARD